MLDDWKRRIREHPYPPGDEPKPDLSVWASSDGDESLSPTLRIGAERVLADCQAKRARAIMLFQVGTQMGGPLIGRALTDAFAGALAKLAEPWSDHPEYRPEWRL